MLTPEERTQRGFRIFGRVYSARSGVIRVQESSEAFEGAHCWLFSKEADSNLSVYEAEELIEALGAFVSEAKEGKLTEPVEYADA